jgi:signal transduction protein with GAF and PtsI domain
MARMGSIPRDATNAAAAAFRDGELRTVNGEGLTNGALVAPLMTAGGCIGVLSAEMKGGSEKDESSQALASIFAAQLATLVSPPSGAALSRAAEG